MEPAEHQIDLLYAWRDGDRQAGDELVRLHYPSLLAFFMLRVPRVAEDLTQRTFLACTEARNRVRASTFRGYLFGIARRQLAKHFADDQRAEELANIGSARPDSVLSPSGVVSSRQEHWLLMRALEGLDEEDQVILTLYYVHGLRSREVADALDASTTKITTRLTRAREALRKRVGTMRAPAAVRDSLLGDLDRWARSLVPVSHTPRER